MDTPASGPAPVPPPIPAEAVAPVPVTAPEQPAFSMVDASGMVIVARRCISCSYNLMGLSKDGPCPECGTPVANSLRDNLLINSAPEYLARIHKGVFLVQTSIIAQIVLMLGSALGMMAIGAWAAAAAGGGAGGTGGAGAGGMAFGPGAMYVFIFGAAIVTLAISALSLFGWYLLSDADPRAAENDRGEKPRRVVRTTVIVECVLLVGSQVINWADTLGLGGAVGGGGPSILFAVFTILLTVGYYIALAVRYFASMLYIRWLARRLPNDKAHDRAKVMLWLGPVLSTVGIVLCGLGPIIALVLYYNLLEWVRVDLKRIRKTLELKALMPATGPAPSVASPG